MGHIRNKLLIVLSAILITGFLIPQGLKMPVVRASRSDYHPQSFWYYPWGKSITHKGVDIFAERGTKIHASTIGFVVASGEIIMGGNYALVLGPKWRLHYYAHLDELMVEPLSLVDHSSLVGTVGTSGNAAGKAPHLHYSMLTLIPYPWRIDSEQQGWKKMFYLNPIDYFSSE